MTLPAVGYQQFTPDLKICRLLNGMWQVSGGHGPIAPQAARSSMLAHFDAGFTTFDLADHYGPAEDLIGQFRTMLSRERGEEAVSQLQAFTKWVPRPERMTRRIVEEAIDRSRQRMATETLDLLQFHWWDYHNRSYLDALKHLADLQAEGKIRHLALTNFDATHLDLILHAGIKIVSNQVQYSLIDRRPQMEMATLCEAHNISLLTYGTLCGGFLSEKYLNQPPPWQAEALNTVSLRKYKKMIELWGGWGLFQQLLTTLKKIATKYEASIPNIAIRYILEQPHVAGVIIGVRFGLSEHIADNQYLFNFTLEPEDISRIEQVLEQGHNLFARLGDCGAEYR